VESLNDLTNVLIRGLIGFILLLILARLMGKKQLSQITYFEYIVGITIGSIAGELTFSPHIRMSNFILSMFIWSLIPIIISKVSLKSYRFRSIIEGSPTTLIKNGKILEQNLKKESITTEELMIHLRQKNIFMLSDVESAIIETSGEISVMKKSELQPLTPKDMDIVVEQKHQPRLVIMDGNLMERSLNNYGYDKDWLLSEVKKQGANDFHDVFLAQVDSQGNVYVDLYKDKLKLPQIKQKLLTAATIKQLQSSLQTFALQTGNPHAKNMYQSYAAKMDKLLDDMAVYLKE
jgi:uncharacterized membrane protein YcaP (DUF421 family)